MIYGQKPRVVYWRSVIWCRRPVGEKNYYYYYYYYVDYYTTTPVFLQHDSEVLEGCPDGSVL